MEVASIDLKMCNPPKDATRMKKHNSCRLEQGFIDDDLILLSIVLLMNPFVADEKFFYAAHQRNKIGQKGHE